MGVVVSYERGTPVSPAIEEEDWAKDPHGVPTRGGIRPANESPPPPPTPPPIAVGAQSPRQTATTSVRQCRQAPQHSTRRLHRRHLHLRHPSHHRSHLRRLGRSSRARGARAATARQPAPVREACVNTYTATIYTLYETRQGHPAEHVSVSADAESSQNPKGK